MNTSNQKSNRKLLFYVTLFGIAAYIGLSILKVLTDAGEWSKRVR